MQKPRLLSVLLVLALVLLATLPAFAQKSVKELVRDVRDGVKIDTVLESGDYVVSSNTAASHEARFSLVLVSPASKKCFSRNDLNGRSAKAGDEIDRRTMEPHKAWRYFTVKKSCPMRFQVTVYKRGSLDVRSVKKVKTIDVTSDWKKFQFNRGHWSGSAKEGKFKLEIDKSRVSAGCAISEDVDGMRSGLVVQGGDSSGNSLTLTEASSFKISAKAEPCVMYMRAVSGSKAVFTKAN